MSKKLYEALLTLEQRADGCIACCQTNDEADSGSVECVWNDSCMNLISPVEAVTVIRELKRYIEAEQAGLLVRLPCKVGDTVYMINVIDKCIDTYTLHAITVDGDGAFEAEYYDDDEERVYSANLGFDGYLTLEEARAALKAQEEKNHV